MRTMILGLVGLVMVGCGPHCPPTLTPTVIVGCEYYFDPHGVSGWYWMNGVPHQDLTIRACYDLKGQKVEGYGRS